MPLLVTADPIIKDPDAVLDYSFDWSDWLTDDDVIDVVVLTADTGITLAPAGHPTAHTATVVTFWLAGGTAGTQYNVVCHVESTGSGRKDDRTMTVYVKER